MAFEVAAGISHIRYQPHSLSATFTISHIHYYMMKVFHFFLFFVIYSCFYSSSQVVFARTSPSLGFLEPQVKNQTQPVSFFCRTSRKRRRFQQNCWQPHVWPICVCRKPPDLPHDHVRFSPLISKSCFRLLFLTRAHVGISSTTSLLGSSSLSSPGLQCQVPFCCLRRSPSVFQSS